MFNKRIVFGSACVGILFFGLAITTLGSVVTELKTKYAIDDISVGAIFSILPFGILVGSLVFGPVVDRYGYRVLLAFTGFSMAIGFVGIAVAPALYALKICVFLFGLGGGAINGATSALVSDISGDSKGANLSILGVFFAVGALGMPFILAILEDHLSFATILLVVGSASFFIGIIYLLLKFPTAKQVGGLSLSRSASLLKEPFLLWVAFFLFFQSAFEGIIENWTTSYLRERLHFASASAKYVLSFFVAGMAVMRLLLASVFKTSPPQKIWMTSFALLFGGPFILLFARTFYPVLVGFVAIGAGLAAGFPIMLGYLGDRYHELSGTAFSIAFTIALAGNILINYLMGYVAQHFGIQNLLLVALAETMLMGILCLIILRKMNQNK